MVLAQWRSRDPETLNESEILENMFNVLCLLLVFLPVFCDVAIASKPSNSARKGDLGPAADPDSKALLRSCARL